MSQIKKLAYGLPDSPMTEPSPLAASPGASVVKTPPVTATAPIAPVSAPAKPTTAAPAPTTAPTTPSWMEGLKTTAGDLLGKAKNFTTGWMEGLKTTAGDLLGKAKNFTTGLMGDQFNRAGAHYALSRTGGQNPLQAGLGAFGQLNTTTRGLGGGAAGLLGASMLSPAGTRGYTMPLAGGLGAMFATANGPDGFKWENMLKPDALMAGGLGAGAGWLGSKFMGDGDDEEEDDKTYDPAGLHKRRSSGGGSSWLPTLAGVGALGLGAYGLHKYMQPGEAPPAPPAVNKEIMGPPAPPAAPPIAPAAPPAPPAALAPVPGITPGAAGPDQALIAAQQNPDNLVNNIRRMNEVGMAPGPRQSLGNLVGNFHQVESTGANTNGMPRTSDIYRRIYSGEATPEEAARAPKFIEALDAAKQVAEGVPFEGLQRAEALRSTPLNNNIPHDVQQGTTGFPIKGMEALGAFGVKDLTHLSNMAAKGDPVVSQVLDAMGPEGRRSLLTTLTEGGYSKYKPSGGTDVQFSAAASNPRSAALLGALQSASTGQGVTPEPYDTKAFLTDSEGLRGALRPGQKVQLIKDIGDNLDTFASKFKELPLDQQRTAARNLAGLLSRTAYGAEQPGGNVLPKEVPEYLDTNVQKAVARLNGNTDYKPVDPGTWRELAFRGLDSSGSLGPYSDPNKKVLKSPEDLELRLGNPPEGYSPADITLKQSPDSDKQVINDWKQIIKDHYLQTKDIPTGNSGALTASLQTLRESRPDLYRQLVQSLQNDPETSRNRLVNSPTDWDKQLAGLRGHSDPAMGNKANTGLDLTTGRRYNNAGKAVAPQDFPRNGPVPSDGWATSLGAY